MSILFFTSCNSQKKEKQTVQNYIIEKIIFSEVNTSEPISNEFYVKNTIQFSLDSVSFFTEKYEGEELVKSDKIKSYSNSNEKLFREIPEKYLIPKDFTYLNYYPENDGEYIDVTIYLDNGNLINWTLSYEENDLPQELKSLLKNFIISKNKFQ